MGLGNLFRKAFRVEAEAGSTRFRFLKGFEEIRGEEFRLVLVEKMPEDRYRGWVPSYRYEMWPLTDDEVLGTIDIRIGDNENIFYAGHIGYRVFADTLSAEQ